MGCRKWGCNKWGFKGCLAALPGIGQNRPFPPFFCLFCPFPEGAKSTWEIQKTEEKGLFPQISSDLLKPPSLKPPFAALQQKGVASLFGNLFLVFGHFSSAFFLAFVGGSQKGGFQKGGFGGCSPGTKTGTRVHSPKPPFWKPPFYLPVTLFGVDKRVVSKRVVSADVPPERKPERGYVRQNHPFRKPPFYLPVISVTFRLPFFSFWLPFF